MLRNRNIIAYGISLEIPGSSHSGNRIFTVHFLHSGVPAEPSREYTRNAKLQQKFIQKECVSRIPNWHFSRRAKNILHFTKPQLKPSKGHLSDPDPSAKALKCRRTLGIQYSIFCTTWLNHGIKISTLTHDVTVGSGMSKIVTLSTVCARKMFMLLTRVSIPLALRKGHLVRNPLARQLLSTCAQRNIHAT